MFMYFFLVSKCLEYYEPDAHGVNCEDVNYKKTVAHCFPDYIYNLMATGLSFNEKECVLQIVFYLL